MKELTLDEKHKILLEILIDIDRFCRENNIPYVLSAGSLLGAVRHGGFIPWDDDADLFMLREDFDRFVKIYRSPRFHLLYNTRKDDEFLASSYAKINDPGTEIDTNISMAKFGMNVDIFPLDAVPEDPKKRHKYMHRIMHLHNRLHHRHKTDWFSILKAHYHSFDWWWNKIDKIVHQNKYKDSPMVAQMIGCNNYRTVLRKDLFNDLADIKFEGHDFLTFRDPHPYLEMLYGSDYMTPHKWNHAYKCYYKEPSLNKDE